MEAFWRADFESLEQLHADLHRRNPLSADGGHLLHRYRNAVANVLKGPKGATESYFQLQEALTLQWTKDHPKSALAHVLHAQAMRSRAWWHRGTGYSSTVSADAMQEFKRHTQRAIDHLARHGDIALRTTSAHVLLILLSRDAGLGSSAMRTVALAGYSVNKADDRLFSAWIEGTTPKWGGSAQLVDRAIQEAVALTRPDWGEIKYARLYAEAAEAEFHHQLFDNSGASWPRMKMAYQELLHRFPTAVHQNAFAYFACIARDKPTFLEQLDKLGAEPMLAAWGNNPRQTYEGCKRWAAKQ